MTLFFGLNVANAETQTPYSVDFDTSIDTSVKGFKVAPGWKHIVPSSAAATYAYTTSAYYVAGGSGGSLSCTQGNNKDILVTPKITGEVSLDVCQSYYTSKIEFYKIEEAADGTLTVGDQIQYNGTLASSYSDSYGSNTWVTLSFTLDEATRIGIRAGVSRAMYIDNFTATSADVVLAGEMAINSVDQMKIGDKVITSSAGDKANCDEDNNLQPISFTVSVTNTGERELVAGEDNFSVSIVDYSNNGYVLATKPVEENLAIGASTQVTVVASINYNTYPFDRHRMDVKENMTNTTAVGMWVETNPYISKFALTLPENSSEIESGTAIPFGMISATVTKTFAIRNGGAAPLKINSITAPAGYTLNVTGPLTVPALSSQAIEITLPATNPGYFAGDLTISYKDNENNDVEHLLALSGTVLDPAKWYATFDDGKFPSGTYHGANWETNSSTNYKQNASFIQNGTANSHAVTTDALFVTPLLSASAGETLQFDVARRTKNNNDDTHFLAVYISNDRKNWSLLRKIEYSELTEAQTTLTSTYYSNYSDFDFQTFAVNIETAGNYYIGFDAGYVRLDNIYGLTLVPVDHDVLFTATLPTDGQTNHDLTIKTTAQNLLATAESDYTVKYYVDGVVAAQGEAVELTQGTKKDISFTYTPYMAGTYDTYAELEFIDGTKYTSDHVKLTVTEEQVVGLKAVGNAKSTDVSANIPIQTNFISAQTEVVYLADEIGLPIGTEIKSITFKGYRTSSENSCSVQIWMEETEDVVPASTGTSFVSMSDESKVYDGTYTFKKEGSSNSLVDIVTITLAEPFTYNGGNLRLAFQSTSANFGPTYYQRYSTTNAKYRNQDKALDAMTTSFSNVTYNPVIYLGYDKEASTFSGVLSIDNADNTNTPIVGATVTLTNGNTKYAGKTDAQGYYSFNVLQDDKTYDITTDYTAKNYFPQSQEETTVTFQGQSVVKNITLTEAVDFYLNGYEAPDKGKVGVEYTATATVTNYNKAVMEAGDYTATLYVGNLAVPATETVNLAEMEEHTFSFTFVPETDGVQTAYIQFAGPTRTIQTEEFTFTVEGVHGVTIAANLPTAGQVNHTVEAAATVTNNLDATEAADSYTIKYFVNGEAVSEATSVDLPKNSAKQFAFSFMPHATGSYTTYVELRFNDGLGTFKSEEVTLEIGSEIASAEKVVVEGNSVTGGYNGESAPISAYNKGTQSEMIYTAQQLGISANTKITSISFKGYSTSAFTFPVKVWVANTEDTAPASSGTEAVSTDNMTKVFEASSVTFNGGSSTGLIDLTFDFDSPFTYDGTNLRVFVESTYASSYNNGTYFSKNTDYNTQVAWRSADSNLETKAFANTRGLPALSIGYEKAPSVFTGVLSMNKADNTNTKIGGATVTLTAEDGVSYSGETGPDGRYTFPVIQDNKTYTVTVTNLPTTLPAAFPLEKTITFNGQSIEENITLTEAVDFYLSNLDVPEAGMVNHDLTITIDVTNYGEAKATDDYTATLYFVGGEETEAVATAETVAIGEMETKTLTFHVTPYGAGTVPLYIELVTNNRSFKTDNFNVTIEEEFTGGEITVGTKTGTSGYTPFYWSWADNTVGGKVDFYYTPEQLAKYGVTADSKITHITFKGTPSGNKTFTSATVKGWIGLQSEDDFVKGNTEGLNEYVILDNAPLTLTADEVFDLTFDFSDSPIVYDGTSILRIATLVNGSGTWASVSYDVEADAGVSYYGYGASPNWSTLTSVPVGIFTIDNTNTISGVVTSDGTTPMANVKVIAQSDNVIYKTYTDDEGKYELVVCQTDKTYTLTASRNGEDTDPYVEEGLTFDNGDIVRNIVLGTYMLTLDESEFDGNLPSGLQGEAIVKYSAKAGWNTICEPFALTNEILTQIFGDEYKAYELVGGDNGVLTFTQPTAYVAGRPYVVFCKTPVVNENGLLVHGISIDAAQPQAVTYGGVTFQGTYAPIAAPGMEGLYGIVPTTGRIQKGSDKASLKGFRAYFKVSDGVDPANLSFSFDDGTIITGIDDATLMDNGLLTTDSAIYDLRGRKVAEAGHAIRLPKGVYIQNGRKITVK